MLGQFTSKKNDKQIAELYQNLSCYPNQQLIQMATCFELMTRLHSDDWRQSISSVIKDDQMYLDEVRYFLSRYVDNIQYKLRNVEYKAVEEMVK